MNGADRLGAGLRDLTLDLPAATQERLRRYLGLLAKWNRTYNLTAVHYEAEMVSVHLLDSLAVLPHLGRISSLADVGSGAGLPGIPLALARPELRVTLIESSHKKASFLQQAKIELGLANVGIHCGRVELATGLPPFDAVISRAFSELAEFVRLAGHLPAPGGRLLAMKGVLPQGEIERLPDGWRLVQALPLAVPGLAAQRHLIVIERA
ncbi:ribosomal RNA small subunit methyltransferase G [mine drainage metagenome]|uniref:Ribosomal RNA small subunit methyltransferase G n=1 Tax=mine drainage metagenome TaxID=410659 RepID=A0A1J5S5W1_9ZZZZ